MTTRVTITGTGCPTPDPDRAGPGVLVEADGLRLQFDAGRSTVQRLAACGLRRTELDAVFVTHHHSDHLTGLADIVLTRWVMSRGEPWPPLEIVVPDGPAADYAREMLGPWRHDLAVRREHTGRTDPAEPVITAFDVPVEPDLVWERGELRVLAGPVRHEPVHPAVGYRIETPAGVVAITGDTLVCPEVAALAAGADVLIYEAMRFEFIEQRPPHLQFVMDYHADSRRIGEQAVELGVPTLVLTHLIPAPRDDADRAGYEADIRAGGYTGDLIVADDLEQITLG